MDLYERDRELLRRASELAREADAVLDDLGLLHLITTVGRAERVGSASFGLALSRDIDIDVLCLAIEPRSIWDALRPLAGHSRVKKVRWSDERGPFNTSGEPWSDGIYVGVHAYAGEVRDDSRWKIDCWFFQDAWPRPDIDLRNRLLSATDEERLAILRLKDAGLRDGRYGPAAELHGIDIYRAVLDRRVRRYEDL